MKHASLFVPNDPSVPPLSEFIAFVLATHRTLVRPTGQWSPLQENPADVMKRYNFQRFRR